MAGCFSLLRKCKHPVRPEVDSHSTAEPCVEDFVKHSWLPPPEYTVKSPREKATADPKSFGIMSDVASVIEAKIMSLSVELRELSLKMWENPEVKWEEYKTHDMFVQYFRGRKGWKVTPHAYGLETAFKVEFCHAQKGMTAKEALPTVGFQAELDALPGIGHACGHNCISCAGVAASLAVAETLVKFDQPGRVILLGTPAEEGGGGKLNLIQAGAYKEMDACLMVHPAPLSSVGPMIAVIEIDAVFTGQTSHAGAAPWEGINAQDAGVLAYMNVSALRQQIKPTHRVHGIIQGKDWAANVIPDYCKLIYNARAPTVQELEELIPRVVACFEAAALATGCKVKVTKSSLYKNVVNAPRLSKQYQSFMKKRYNQEVGEETFFASTDFGNVTFELPALHAEYAIPLKDPKTDGNHTIGFAKASKTMEAHQLTLKAATGIATIGAKIIYDEEYRKETQREWRDWKDSLP